LEKPIDANAFDGDPSVIYVLDRGMRLRSCNPAWDRFAKENSGEHLLRPMILGRPVFDFISGVLADYYRDLFARILESGVDWHQEYECSSPEVMRTFAMHIYPVHGELLIVNSIIVQGPHEGEAFPPVEARYRNVAGVLVMCSNCRRAKAGSEERWDWVPGFVTSQPPKVSHGLCSLCYEFYIRKLHR
jgi:hypothetical protein